MFCLIWLILCSLPQFSTVFGTVVSDPEYVLSYLCVFVSLSLSCLILCSGNSKAAEAAGSAYYNPSNPHNVYMPMVRCFACFFPLVQLNGWNMWLLPHWCCSIFFCFYSLKGAASTLCALSKLSWQEDQLRLRQHDTIFSPSVSNLHSKERTEADGYLFEIEYRKGNASDRGL